MKLFSVSWAHFTFLSHKKCELLFSVSHNFIHMICKTNLWDRCETNSQIHFSNCYEMISQIVTKYEINLEWVWSEAVSETTLTVII